MIAKFEELNLIDNDHERIIILRKRLGKSQHQFAKDIGISSSYLGQIENYKYPCTPRIKERINNYLRQEIEIDEKDLFSNFK